MVEVRGSPTLRTIPFLIATCHGKRSAAVKFRGMVAVVLFLLTIVSTATAKYSGGSGTAQDPYQIATAADLIALGEAPGDYDKHFILTADIDLDPNLPGRKVFDRAVIAPDTNPTRVEFQGAAFTGVFDGNGHTISHLTIDGGDSLGLFGRLAGGEVKNLGLVDVSITGIVFLGALAGTNLGDVVYCYSSGAIHASGRSGGLLGQNYGSVTRCYSAASVSGGGHIGGLTGYSGGGLLLQCYSTGDVNGSNGSFSVGGLVGLNQTSVVDCYSTAAVSGGTAVGGLVGWNGVPAVEGVNLIRCYSMGAVTGNLEVGGLVGRSTFFGRGEMCFWDRQTSGQLASAVGTGLTTAEMQTGVTFFGWNICASAAWDLHPQGFEEVWTINEDKDYPRLRWENRPGRPIGARLSDFLTGEGTQDSPYLIYTAEDLDIIEIFPCEQDKHFRLGFLAGQGTQENPYLIYTIDEINLLNNCPYERAAHFRLMFVKGEGTRENPYLIYTIDEINLLNNCPYERAARFRLMFVKGEGTRENPYLIYTAHELNLVGVCVGERDAHFKLMVDIDLSALDGKDGRTPFHIIGTGHGDTFAGVFDGHGHTISHLTIEGESYLGLFGELSSGAHVKNLGVLDVNITGSSIVGGLVGSNSGSVTQCYNTGSVRGTSNVGGLVGFSLGDVTHSSSSAFVTRSHFVSGGLVGTNYGVVTCSFSTGTVHGNERVGGLVGYNSPSGGGVGGTVERCYSTGAVDGVTRVGGLVGCSYGGDVTDCYSTARVRGGGYAGGLVGSNDGAPIYEWDPTLSGGNVTRCYSAGAVSGAGVCVGGLVGSNGGTVTSCFYDTQTSGQRTTAGGTGKTTAEMKTPETFLEAGWDFVGETANGTEDLWWILEGRDYPRLGWEWGQTWLSYPQDGAVDVAPPLILFWAPAGLTLQHDVHLGENEDAVANATPETLGIYRGRQPAETTTYDPGTLELGKTYYWRIDEVNEADPNRPRKGSVWSFTTADSIVVSIVDDFESYTQDSFPQWLCQTWMPGFVNGTGSFFLFAEQMIVHGGWQSMPMDYNWDYNDARPWYSEADRTWITPQDWTIHGADTLTLSFRGKVDNGRGRLYVAIEDSAGRLAVVVHQDEEAVLATEWQKWHIALGEVRATGVDVAAVKKMVIGVGDRENPKPGGTGRIYIDDIRLTRRLP